MSQVMKTLQQVLEDLEQGLWDHEGRRRPETIYCSDPPCLEEYGMELLRARYDIPLESGLATELVRRIGKPSYVPRTGSEIMPNVVPASYYEAFESALFLGFLPGMILMKPGSSYLREWMSYMVRLRNKYPTHELFQCRLRAICDSTGNRTKVPWNKEALDGVLKQLGCQAHFDE